MKKSLFLDYNKNNIDYLKKSKELKSLGNLEKSMPKLKWKFNDFEKIKNNEKSISNISIDDENDENIDLSNIKNINLWKNKFIKNYKR